MSGTTVRLIGAVGSLLGGIAGLVTGFRDIDIPDLPTFKIPETDLEMLSKQIEANTAISEEARKAAVEALQSYNMGKLSPAYEALYNEYAKDRTAQVQQELAARGFTPGSTEYNRVMGELAKDLNAYRAGLLRTQLYDALKVSGLSETTISELYDKWKVQSGIAGAGAETEYLQTQLELGKKKYDIERLKAIKEGLGEFAGGLEDILAPKTEKIETEPIPKAEVPKPEETLDKILKSGGFKVEIPEVKTKTEEE